MLETAVVVSVRKESSSSEVGDYRSYTSEEEVGDL